MTYFDKMCMVININKKKSLFIINLVHRKHYTHKSNSNSHSEKDLNIIHVRVCVRAFVRDCLCVTGYMHEIIVN